MTELQDPLYLEGGEHHAQGLRLAVKSLVAKPGVVGEGDLLVSQKAGTPDMSVDVAAGAVFVDGTQASFQGMYHMVNDGIVNKPIAAADSTNPRIDLVIARVYDGFYSGATLPWDIEVLTGVAEATPSEPAVPDDCEVLARADVPAGVPAIEDAHITDRRNRSSSPTGLRAILHSTADGTFDPGDYPWLRAVRVRLWAGGAGGLGDGGTDNEGGPGGGGAGYCEKWYTIDQLDASEPYTIGNGGNGSQVGPTAGGNTTFKGMIAGGGQPPADHARGGTGGTASGGDVNLTGGNAESRAAKSTYPNTTSPATNGGDAAGPGGGKGGVGAAARAANVNGGNGNIPGGGGGGGFRRTTGTVGGNGGRGEIAFELYA